MVSALQFQYGSIDLSHDYKQYWHLLIQWLKLNHSNNACRCKSRNAITSLLPLTPDYSSISGSPSTTARHISSAKFAHRQLPSSSTYSSSSSLPPSPVHSHHRTVTNVCTSSRGRNLVPVDSLINRWTHIQRPRVRARWQLPAHCRA